MSEPTRPHGMNAVRFLWFVAVILGAAGAVILGMVFWPVPRVPVIPEPPVSQREDDARGAIVEYQVAWDHRDTARLLELTCADPSGSVLAVKKIVQGGGALPDPSFRTIDAYVGFADSGADQVQLILVGVPSPDGLPDIERKGELWRTTVDLAYEDSRWKMCAGM